jgi:hypothetical protein
LTQLLISMLTLLFSMSGPAMEGNVSFWQSSLAAKSGQKVLVIGEDMQRVGPYAQKIGAEIYPGMPGYKAGMDAQALAHNQAFVQQKMAEGYRIIDIGPNFARRAVRGGAQPAYEMERTITKGYQGYEKAFIRTGKDSLILPPP